MKAKLFLSAQIDLLPSILRRCLTTSAARCRSLFGILRFFRSRIAKLATPRRRYMKVARLVIPGNDRAKTAPSTAPFLSSRERRDFSQAGFRAEDQVVPATERNQQDRFSHVPRSPALFFPRYKQNYSKLGCSFQRCNTLMPSK